MVCPAVWMSYSGHTLTDKVMAMLLPIGMFVASGFEHSIANMFLIPLAIIIRYFAPEGFWSAVHTSPDNFPALTVGNFITANLIPGDDREYYRWGAVGGHHLLDYLSAQSERCTLS